MTTAAPQVHQPLPVGWGPRRLEHPKLAAGIVAVVGVFVTRLGAGIAVRYLTTTGLTWTSVLSLVLFVAGLALLGFAGVGAWRSTHRWRRLWFIPIVVVALLVMWSVARGAMLAYPPRNGVLMVDPRGQGRSSGHAMDAGWYGDRDVTAAVTFLQHQPGVDQDRVGVLGLSMGGEEANGAATADPAIRAVVAEGVTHRTAALLSPAPQPGTLHSAVAHARTTPFLLIAAGKGVDKPDAVAYFHTVSRRGPPGASHVHGLVDSPAQWTARVTAFLDHALDVSAG